MNTTARNLPEGSGTPAPPPPPPELAAAERAARQANRVFDALCLDTDATLSMVMFAWDVAAAADRAYYRLLQEFSAARMWERVRPR